VKGLIVIVTSLLDEVAAEAMRGLKVIVPVDGSSAENEYVEQYVAYNLTHAPVIAAKITLTTSDMIKF